MNTCRQCDQRGAVVLATVYIDGEPCCQDHAIAKVGLVEYEAFVENLEGTDAI